MINSPKTARNYNAIKRRVSLWGTLSVWMTAAMAMGQVDPKSRNQIQLGYDAPLQDRGPQAIYAYYYLNVPEFRRTNMALRLAIAPVYLDGELGIREVLPNTDIGIGIAGGLFGDYYYEVRQGHYFRSQSFDGHGGGTSLSIYHLLNPDRRVPLNLIARGGFRFSTYQQNNDTADDFQVPDDRLGLYTRAGLRFGGKEPGLYPDLAMEMSVWFERNWRTESDFYGFNNDRKINSAINLYWLYAGLNYAWTNTGHKMHLGVTAGGSDQTDRFSAWRIGGVLPLVAEFPLILPGYYFQEISAERFVHMQASYGFALDEMNRWWLRVEGASAAVDYLAGFEQDGRWHTGAGGAILYAARGGVMKVALRYGYGFNALRDGEEGAHSVGILFQYDFEAYRKRRHSRN